jgi:hypothetical protein
MEFGENVLHCTASGCGYPDFPVDDQESCGDAA